mgnify:CR=1 FL=1
MAYLFYLPSLLCGLAISVEDARHRRVPALWALIGSLAQLVSNIVVAALGNSFFAVLQSILFALLCTGVMALLALVRSGGIGRNEIRAMFSVGLAVGMCALPAVIVWWLLMLAFGLAFTAFWRRFDPQRDTPYRGDVPFVPVIVVAAICAVAVITVCGM